MAADSRHERSDQLPTNQFQRIFANLPDPRRTSHGNIRHPLTDSLFLVISAVVSGCQDWEAIHCFGLDQIAWLRQFVRLPGGIPSADTLSRIFAMLDSKAFAKCFMRWIKDLSQLTDGEVIAIDGKTVRGSRKGTSQRSAIHLVSAFATANGLCLGQVRTDQKSNEITAIPRLLNLLAIRGATVSIDAMGCQQEIVEKIREKDADYLLAVKANQPQLLEAIKDNVRLSKPVDTAKETDVGHGRVEVRRCTLYDDLTFLESRGQWLDLKRFVKIDTERTTKINGLTESQTRYYITNLEADAQTINRAVRSHWAVENNLHWVLDVVFREDASRKRKGFAAENFNVILKMAQTLLQSDDTEISLQNKRLSAARNQAFRQKILKL